MIFLEPRAVNFVGVNCMFALPQPRAMGFIRTNFMFASHQTKTLFACGASVLSIHHNTTQGRA